MSNETDNIDVFFDNLQVSHIRGPILEETHYYPFGLTMAGISSKALAFGGAENKKKFNDGTELASKEFSDGSGLQLYETRYRSLDPQLGRFWQADPLSQMAYNFSLYAYSNNNPVLLNDPLGLLSDSLHPVVLPAVVVTAKKKPVVQVLVWSKETKEQTGGQKDVGHTAIRIGNIFYGYYPTGGLFGSRGDMHRDSLPQFNSIYNGQEVTYFQLNLTSEQIQKLKEILEDVKNNPGNYNLLDQQCTSVAVRSLYQAGAPLTAHSKFQAIQNISGVGISPNDLRAKLSTEKTLVTRIVKFIVGQ